VPYRYSVVLFRPTEQSHDSPSGLWISVTGTHARKQDTRPWLRMMVPFRNESTKPFELGDALRQRRILRSRSGQISYKTFAGRSCVFIADRILERKDRNG
jgi:hypothetical protein